MKRSMLTIWKALAATLLLALSACSGGASSPPPKQPEPPAPEAKPMTELERRQGAACEALGPKLTQCAYESAKRTLTPEEMKKEQVEEKRPEHTAKIIDECKKQQMSSRQVRVYEVCMREESECAPLLACLDNAKPQPPAPAQ
jgi:hypothetical protein